MLVRCFLAVFWLFIAVVASGPGSAQILPTVFVVPNVSTLQFSSGTYAPTNGSTVVVQGYFYAGDGGGGTFVNVPSGVLPTGYCMQTQGTIKNGKNQIAINPGSAVPAGLDINMTSSGVPTNTAATVSAYSVANQTITLSQNATRDYSGPIYFGGNNGGTTLMDSATTPNCFLRTTTTYSQKEWGAYSNGQYQNNDVQALQNWLDANQPHIAVAGNSVINSPLYCGTDQNGNPITDGTVIQGPSPDSMAVADGIAKPLFLITASDAAGGSSFNGGNPGAMLNMMVEQCSISAVGLIGSTSTTSPPVYDIVEAFNHNNSVLNHSLLYGGLNGFNCEQPGADIEIYDSSISHSADDGISCGAPNSKFQRNVIASVGNNGIGYNGTQSLIEDNIIEESGSDGIQCHNGSQVGIVGNYIDNNGLGYTSGGTTSGGYGVHVYGCQAVSISGNQFHRSDAYDETAGNKTAQVWFDGQNDSVSMAGNVNYVGNDFNSTAMRPDYDVEMGSNAVVTNFSYADSATPQNVGAFGPNALSALGTLQASAPQNYFTGLVTTNSSGSAKLSVLPGEVMDSSNVQMINLPSGCDINLSKGGAGGLDTGPGSAQPGTQYNIFAFAQGGNGSTASCIASTGSAPNFAKAFGTSSPPYTALLQGYVTKNSPLIIGLAAAGTGNDLLNAVAGLEPGDNVADSLGYVQSTILTTLNGLISYNSSAFTGDTNQNSTTITNVQQGTNPLYIGESIGNGSGGVKPIAKGSVITSFTTTGTGCSQSAPCVVMNQDAANTVTPGNLTASGNFTITMKDNAGGSATYGTPDSIYVYNDRYRLIASLYTDASDTNFVPFEQDGDTFYLAAPAPDVNITIVEPPVILTLSSVPSGSGVEAFGRCVATAKVHIYTPGLANAAPQPFPTSPGFDTQLANTVGTSPDTSFPFRVYTDGAQHIAASAVGVNTKLQCMTDGWVLHHSS